MRSKIVAFLLGVSMAFAGAALAQLGGRSSGLTSPASNGVPKPILCTTACNVSAIQVGQSAVVRKTATTARTNAGTVSVDPDLQFTNAPIGTYLVWNQTVFNVLVTSTQGFRVNFGHTNANASGHCTYKGGSPETVAIIGQMEDFDNAHVQMIGVGTVHIMACQGQYLVTTAAATLGLKWGQSTTSANATQVLDQSWQMITRVN